MQEQPPIETATHTPNLRRPILGRMSWAAVVVFVLVVGAITMLVLQRIEAQSRRDIESVLTAVLNTSKEAMRHLVIRYQEDAQTWASSPELLANVKTLLAAPRSREDLLASLAQAKLRASLQPFLDRRGYIGIFIISPDHISLASMRDTNVGTTNLLVKQGDFLARVLQGQVLLSRPMRSDVPLPDASGRVAEGQLTMFVAAPILDERGRAIAILTFRIAPARDFSRIARLGRIGETGDTYAFDRSGKLLTESLFHDQLKDIGLLEKDEAGLLTLDIRNPGGNLVEGFRADLPRSEQPLTRMAEAAIAGEVGADVDGYRDYRGVPVVGAWTWEDEAGFAMATEMDRAEAYRSFHNTRSLMLLGASLLVTLFVSLAAVLSTGRGRALRLAEQMTVALRESEHRYRSLIQAAGNVIVYLSPQGNILEFNDEAERTHRCQRADVLGKNYLDLFVSAGSRSLFTTAMALPDSAQPTDCFESIVQVPDGDRPILLWNLTRPHSEEGLPLGTIAVGQDITEHKRAEERALLAERLAAIGQVSTGLAHESRNALARSQACLEMLSRRVQDRPEAVDLIGRVQIAQSQLLRLYEQVREYAAPIKCDWQRVNLGDIMLKTWDHLLAERDGCHVRLTVNGGDGDFACDLECDVDPFRIEQVFRNVLENACGACGESGNIDIAWSQTSIDGLPAVRVAMSNDGPLMTDEERERIFEAFYTTKTRGTGLGMAISKRIIDAHGGTIVLGEGAAFGDGVKVQITVPRSHP